jgi:hypothetical protein
MNFPNLLKQIDTIFNNCQIRYALIGGYAVAAWGEERATRDIDLLCAEDSSIVIAELKKERLHFEHRVGDWEDPIAEVIRIDLGTAENPFEADILFGIKNAPAGILTRVRSIPIEDFAIPVTSPEDMILLKLLGGSPRDLEDAASILQIQTNKLDFILMRRLCPGSIKGALEKLLDDEKIDRH